MTRREALSRQKILLEREAALRKKLEREMANLRAVNAADSVTDTVDVAFEAESNEMSLHLAELGIHELRQIEKVLTCMKQGTYGICEGSSWNCQKKIPEERLSAIPYATLCIHCQREMEKYSDTRKGAGAGTRDQVFASSANMEEEQNQSFSIDNMDAESDR